MQGGNQRQSIVWGRGQVQEQRQGRAASPNVATSAKYLGALQSTGVALLRWCDQAGCGAVRALVLAQQAALQLHMASWEIPMDTRRASKESVAAGASTPLPSGQKLLQAGATRCEVEAAAGGQETGQQQQQQQQQVQQEPQPQQWNTGQLELGAANQRSSQTAGCDVHTCEPMHCGPCTPSGAPAPVSAMAPIADLTADLAPSSPQITHQQ